MVALTILGVNIDFPFQPYPCQIKYMEKVITCLQKGINGVLESPTGTGKTLCLLCSALAWRESYAARYQLQTLGKFETSDFSENLKDSLGQASGNLNPGGSWERGFSDVPKIIYASRTHSQLAQAISELKSTNYKPRVSVIGSREQMCINPEVLKEESNNGKVHLCRIKVSARHCFYYNSLESQKANIPAGIHDIEDLVNIGTEKQVCPYYLARELKKEADIIFMPYNYVLDYKARQAHGVDLTNTIVLLDEAHNVENVCEANASFDLTSFDLASCIEDCSVCIEILQKNEEEGFLNEEAAFGDLVVQDVCILKALFLKFEEVISKIDLGQNNSATKPGRFIFDLLQEHNINSQTKDQILDVLEKMSGLIAVSSTKGFRAKSYALDKFVTVLKTVFAHGDPSPQAGSIDQSLYYKVHICAEAQGKKKQVVDAWAKKSSASGQGRTLSYWCFNPGLTMQDLVRQGVRSVILTSGTLAPLSSFKHELRIPFQVELENGHVIERHQVFVGVLSHGPDGTQLNSSYQTRSTSEYQVSLGNTIVNLARIIPHGLLVFFPSYPVMDMIIGKWQACGIWNRLSQIKGLFIEPRGKSGFSETMEQFYEKVNDPELKGAAFFAVCRGKVSEGLDFADTNGRAVIITGLPYPPSFDPRVILKRQYLDEQKSQGQLTGNLWYRQQASRAVNQAVGRVIRHKNDFGAILLCDERFRQADVKDHLPGWIRQQLQEYKDFGKAQRELVRFFRELEQKLPPANCKVKTKRKLHEAQADSRAEASCVSARKQSKLFDAASVNSAGCSKVDNRQVPALNGKASNSLALLQATDGGPAAKSVFESLNNLEQASPVGGVEVLGGDLSRGIALKSNPAVQPSVAKAKKYRIVPRDKQEQSGASATSSGERRVEDAKQYLSKVKRNLPADKYVKFGIAMRKYKQSGKIEELMSDFEEVFDTSKAEDFDLLLGFGFFVKKSDDKKIFDETCEKLSVTRCIICHQAALSPHYPPCLHKACYPCWIKRIQSGERSCPSCNLPVKKWKLKAAFMENQYAAYGYDWSSL